MDELVQQIEGRIRLLLQKYTDLRKHNAELSQTKQRLALENEHLLSKHKNVAGLVEHTIARLKSIEGLT
jgi:regulator of replication initiation timing